AGKSPTALAIRDGEMLYLRPRQAQLPELAFDDVADAVATASRDRSTRWQPQTTRRTGLAVGVVRLVPAAGRSTLAGPPGAGPAVGGGERAGRRGGAGPGGGRRGAVPGGR